MSNIYLISPPEIDYQSFSKDLKDILSTNLVKIFQLRLKDYSKAEITKISKNIQKICFDYDCTFIVNDHLDIVCDNNIDGVHLGQEDINNHSNIKDISKEFIVGVSCYDNIDYAINASELGANYVSFGAFYPTLTKISPGSPKIDIISQFAQKSPLPIVAIGGINDKNCYNIARAGADFIAIISYIWNSDDKVASLKLLHSKIHEK